MKKIVLIFGIMVGAAHGQIQFPYVLAPSSDPTGQACSQAPQIQTLYSTGALYTCKNGTIALASSTGGTGALAPSGDTTGVTDTASINSAYTAGVVNFGAGTFYANGPFNVTKPLKVNCVAGQTIININSATGGMWNINFGGGAALATISNASDYGNCTYRMTSGLTPTAGDVFALAGVDGTHFLSALNIHDNIMIGTWGCFNIGSFVLSDWITHNLCFNTVSGGDGLLVYDNRSPAGDLLFDGNQASGNFTGIMLHSCDAFTISNTKLNGAALVFDPLSSPAEACSHVSIINPSFEGAVGGGAAVCGIDFGLTGSVVSPTIKGGGVGLMTTALCNTTSAALVSPSPGYHADFLNYDSTHATGLHQIIGTTIESSTFPTGAAISGSGLSVSGTITGLGTSVTEVVSGLIGGTPATYYVSSTAPTDEKLWRLQGDGSGHFSIIQINDAQSVALTPMQIVSTGSVISAVQFTATAMATSGTFTATGAATVASLTSAGQIGPGGMLSTGTQPTLALTTGLYMGVAGAEPREDLINSAAPSNAKTYQFKVDSSGNLVIQTVNDAFGSVTSFLTLARTGQAPLSATFNSPLIATTIAVASARKGTFVCTGAGTITITNANYAATSDVSITMNTAGGTITTPPAFKTVTPATGFTVLCGATDTSTYNYDILN